jgi:carbamoyltransferase
LDPETGRVLRLVEEDKYCRHKNTPLIDRAALAEDVGEALSHGGDLAVSHFTSLPERPAGPRLPLWEPPANAVRIDCGPLEQFASRAWGRPAVATMYWHELAHVFTALAYRERDDDEFLGLVVEGCGAFAQSSLFHFLGREVQLVDYDLPVISGNCFQQWLAEAVLGIDRSDRAARKAAPGKLMALAAYGDPGRFAADVRETVRGIERRRYYDYRRRFLPEFKRRFLTWAEKLDLCAAVQQVFEELLVAELQRVRDKFGELPLYYAGGCALSIKANSRVREVFPRLTIPPNCADDGQALGLAAAHLFFSRQQHVARLDHCAGLVSSRADMGFAHGDADSQTLQATAELLNRGEIVAMIDGLPEIGPRALGRRSLLAAPSTPHMRQIVNHVKRREYYRPVAPVVLHEVGEDIFEGYFFSPYMLYDFRVRPPYRDKIRECLHEDGTARLQSVLADSNLGRLLKAVERHTRVAVLINTSLNRKGFPIAADEDSVLDEIKGLGVGYAIIGGRLMRLNTHGRFEPFDTAVQARRAQNP